MVKHKRLGDFFFNEIWRGKRPVLTSVGVAEVGLCENRAEVGGGGLRGGGGVRRRGHRDRGGGLRFGLGDAPEGDLVRGLPLQRDGVALQCPGGGRPHRPDPRGFQRVHRLSGLKQRETN